MQSDAQLVLSSGEVFRGKLFSKNTNIVLGEVVFNTGMVGYVESLTDPSYAGQILAFTYPLIGNYGVTPKETWESERIHVRGVVVSELAPYYSNHQAINSLRDWLADNDIPVLTHVDTRALTKSLRQKGVVAGAIAKQHASVDHFESFDEIDWVDQVSIAEPILYGSGRKKIILVDCGMKHNILRSLLKYPLTIKRVPHDYDYSQEDYDGVLLSNGPGDPLRCQKTIEVLKQVMQQDKPIFGICLGTQLMALAANAKTYKLPFGHRSHNQPCLHLQQNKCYLTSQNHGYAILENSLTSDWRVSFRNLNDHTVAGIEHVEKPFFSVQFHPESAPGPEDTAWLFERFYALLTRGQRAESIQR